MKTTIVRQIKRNLWDLNWKRLVSYDLCPTTCRSKITDLDFRFRHWYAAVHIQRVTWWSVSSLVCFFTLGTSYVVRNRRPSVGWRPFKRIGHVIRFLPWSPGSIKRRENSRNTSATRVHDRMFAVWSSRVIWINNWDWCYNCTANVTGNTVK